MKSEIIVGQKFGKWKVLDNVPIYTKGGQRNVKVQCECGVIEYKHWSSLRLGKTTKCLKCSRRQNRIKINIGDKYKKYIVISDMININGVGKYKVKCDCGHEQYMTASALISTTRWFQCKHCATLESVNNLANKNGKIGDLTLSMVNRIKAKAELRHINFNLSIEYLWNLFIAQNKKCAITGDDLLSIKQASLDRIDNSKGYIENNVQWTTKQANLCKHILSNEELYIFAQKVINHANQQPSFIGI